MPDRLFYIAATIILCACYSAPRQDASEVRTIQEREQDGKDCSPGMRMTDLGTWAGSVCLPFGNHWRQERVEFNDHNDLSIDVFSPVSSSPWMYASYRDKNDEGRGTNVILEPHFAPESDAVLSIHISKEDPPHPFPWSEIWESYVAGINRGRYDIVNADPDTLKTVDLAFREMVLQYNDPSLKGKAWCITTRSGVNWAYELWVRRIEYTGQVRAGITAIIQDEDKSVLISTQWLRKGLPNELDEVRSDSLFVIFNEVVESFKWPGQ